MALVHKQILHGAASWPGAEKASFTLSFQWDTQFLYVAARVRDEAYVQNEVGPSVWRGDALWLYFNLLGDRRSLDAKLTLAQTPAGPQIWNWRAQSFQPGAVLAWQATPTGYLYEAALPWTSFHVNPAQRARFFFDAGIGFGASGFIGSTLVMAPWFLGRWFFRRPILWWKAPFMFIMGRLIASSVWLLAKWRNC